MKRRSLLTVAPLCICGVVLLAGANGEKPVPEYMQLMLLEQQYAAQATHHSSLMIRAELTWLGRDNDADVDDAIDAFEELTDASQLRLTKLEEKLGPLRRRVLGPDADLASYYMNDDSRKSETTKLLDRVKKRAAPRVEPKAEKEAKPPGYGNFQF